MIKVRHSVVIGIILFAVLVATAFVYGVDWTIDDQKYVCDCNDVLCDPLQWFVEHATGLFWFILLMSFAALLFPYVIEFRYFENGSG